MRNVLKAWVKELALRPWEMWSWEESRIWVVVLGRFWDWRRESMEGAKSVAWMWMLG